MKGIIYELCYERTFMDVADTEIIRSLYDKKEDAIRALKYRIEAWTKSKLFSSEDAFKVDKSNSLIKPTFYIKDGKGNSICAEIVEHNIETTY